MGAFDAFKGLVGLDNILGLDIDKSTDNSRNLTVNANTFRFSLFDLSRNSSESLDKLKEAIQPLIRESIREELGFLGTTVESNQKIALTAQSEQRIATDQKSFVMNHIPTRDRGIWLAALVIRDQSELRNNEEVRRLKIEVVNRYPGKGRNITNLCTAGYLEDHIMPLYQHVAVDQKDESLFLSMYDSIVEEMPFAVFVSQNSTATEVKEEILAKIEKIGKYGLLTIMVHGMGRDNVQKIKRVALELEAEPRNKVSRVDFLASDENLIKVAIRLKR